MKDNEIPGGWPDEALFAPPPVDQAQLLADALQAKADERAQLGILLDEGVAFTTPVRSVFRWFGKKERRWLLRQPYLGTLDHMARELIDLSEELADKALSENDYNAGRKLMLNDSRRCARIVAIAVLNKWWLLGWLVPLLAWYFLWRITPDKLLKLVLLIEQQSNLPAFITSIKSLSLTPRTTQPTLIEKQRGVPPTARLPG